MQFVFSFILFFLSTNCLFEVVSLTINSLATPDISIDIDTRRIQKIEFQNAQIDVYFRYTKRKSFQIVASELSRKFNCPLANVSVESAQDTYATHAHIHDWFSECHHRQTNSFTCQLLMTTDNGINWFREFTMTIERWANSIRCFSHVKEPANLFVSIVENWKWWRWKYHRGEKQRYRASIRMAISRVLCCVPRVRINNNNKIRR